jgi:hypothetical protein
MTPQIKKPDRLSFKKSPKAVTFLDANDAVSWQAQGRPWLFDGNDQPEPAFHAVIALATGDQPIPR